jgi:hypothetical protein
MRRTIIRRRGKQKVGEIRTFTINPQEGTHLSPILKCAAFRKPQCGTIMTLSERSCGSLTDRAGGASFGFSLVIGHL